MAHTDTGKQVIISTSSDSAEERSMPSIIACSIHAAIRSPMLWAGTNS